MSTQLSAFDEAFIAQGSVLIQEQLDLVEHLQQTDRAVEIAGFSGCGVLVLAMYMHFLQHKTSFRLSISKAPRTLEDWRVVQTHSTFTFILYSVGIFLCGAYACLSEHMALPLRGAMLAVLALLSVLAYGALEYVLPQRKEQKKTTNTLQVPEKDQPAHTPSTVAGSPHPQDTPAQFVAAAEEKGEKEQKANKRLTAPARGGGRH
eukprot:GDKI01000809.1.p1 GENE.GDKI01000809.1~~GDKI01000809.1.p1  ORF type:complete len:205 (-),score=60.46 GDKI01000809.1:170-784(-)